MYFLAAQYIQDVESTAGKLHDKLVASPGAAENNYRAVRGMPPAMPGQRATSFSASGSREAVALPLAIPKSAALSLDEEPAKRPRAWAHHALDCSQASFALDED